MTADEPHFTIVANPSESRYEIRLDGELAGYSEYEVQAGVITFTHTEIFPAFGGRGVGSKLAAFGLDDALTRGLEIRVECPFIAAYVRRHPESVIRAS